MSITRLQTNVRLAGATIHAGLVYLSGQVPDDRTLDCASQTKQVLDKIDALLMAAGTDKSQVLVAQIWLKDIEKDFSSFNTVWEGWVAVGGPPARAAIQAEMASPEVLVEVMVTAAI